jgi:acyl dehydratase
VNRLVYAEDYEVGSVYKLGSYTVTAAEITEFGRTYDPQPYHVDEEEAKASSFGGLIASGWQVAAIWMRLYVTSLLKDAAAEGSPGVDEVRFLRPVRPGSQLSGTAEILGSVPSLSSTDIRIVRNKGRLLDGDGAEVLSLVLSARFRRRSVAA